MIEKPFGSDVRPPTRKPEHDSARPIVNAALNWPMFDFHRLQRIASSERRSAAPLPSIFRIYN